MREGSGQIIRIQWLTCARRRPSSSMQLPPNYEFRMGWAVTERSLLQLDITINISRDWIIIIYIMRSPDHVAYGK